MPPPPTDIRSMDVEEALELFLSVMLASGASEKTLLSYKAGIKDFITISGVRKVEEINSSKIIAWINTRLLKGFRGEDKRRRQMTMHYYTMFVRKWLTWMGFPKNTVPVVRKPRRAEIEALRDEDIERLFSGAQDLLDYIILSLLLETGMRANELLSLRVEDIDLSSGEIRVRNAKYGKERTVFIGPLSKSLLKEFVKRLKPSARIVPLSYNGLYKRLKAIARRGGLPERKVRPHVLRHTFATQALRKGMSLPALQRILGHTDIKITELYMHLLKEDLRVEYQRVFGSRMNPGLVEEPSNNGEGFIFCPSCGRRIPASSRYCPYCGTRVVLSPGEIGEHT